VTKRSKQAGWRTVPRGRGVTGKKASFGDDTEHCFSAEKNGLEEILHTGAGGGVLHHRSF